MDHSDVRAPTPLPVKLGINAESQVLLSGAPEGWQLAGSPTPPQTRAGKTPYDVIVAFCPDLATLERRFVPLSGRLTPAGALWVCWPKKSSGVVTDVGEAEVRAYGLASGLVDVKIAAVDSTWSGLKFVRRLRDR